MSSRLELQPADLDRLEDALEDLELDGFDPAEHGGDDDPVAQRLVELRELLQLCRQALPMEEVPAGLLDGVLAQAQQAASASAAAKPERDSLWSRWRLGVWVPALAFAGSAALLLVVLVPKQEQAGQDDASVARAEPHEALADEAAAKADETPKDGRLAYADLDAVSSTPEGEGEDQGLRGQGLAIGERAPDPEAAAAEPPVDDEAEATSEKAARRKSASGSAGASPTPKPSPKAPASNTSQSKGKVEIPSETKKPAEPGTSEKPSKKDQGDGVDLWPEITRADADRRGGRCGLAKMRYEKARKADDARVRARALAGLGLCEAADGSLSTATKLFDQARSADPGVAGFIEGELAALDRSRANAPAQVDDALE